MIDTYDSKPSSCTCNYVYLTKIWIFIIDLVEIIIQKFEIEFFSALLVREIKAKITRREIFTHFPISNNNSFNKFPYVFYKQNRIEIQTLA